MPIPAIPEGVILRTLQSNTCSRGSTTELYRQAWYDGFNLPQWNLIESYANTIRGMQVHRYRTDYLCVVSGEALAGLYDLRPDSPTNGLSCLLPMTAEERCVVIIPPGVMHGFFFKVNTFHTQGFSIPWTGDDDFRCLWNDPNLGLEWPTSNPIISDLDRQAGSFADIRTAFEERWKKSV